MYLVRDVCPVLLACKLPRGGELRPPPPLPRAGVERAGQKSADRILNMGQVYGVHKINSKDVKKKDEEWRNVM